MGPALRLTLRGWCLLFCLSAVSASALADVPLATREADRQAKAATPSAAEALIYVYRAADRDTAPLTVTVAGRDGRPLAPRTFGWWKVRPGRHAVAVENSTATIALQAEGGRVYYVEAMRGTGRVPILRPVGFAQGRSEVQRSQLVAGAAPTRPSAPVFRAGATHGAIALKLGAFTLAEPTQTILGAQRAFDDAASSVFALEGEWFLQPEFSMGLELLRYVNDYTTPSGVGPGETETTALLFNVKHYFSPNHAWQPYIGAGLGAAMTDTTAAGPDAFFGETSGLALQLVGGVQWRWNQLALRGEYKYVSAKTEDDMNREIDVSGSGFFIGAAFYF